MPDILATTWTTSGDSVPIPGFHTSPLTLRERIEAAAAAGFAGFGMLDFDLEVFLRDSDLATLRLILDDNGLRWREVEFLVDWFCPPGPRREASDRSRRLLLDAAEVLGADHIKIGPDFVDMAPPDLDRWAEELSALASQAAERGSSVALEFLPYFSSIPDLAGALELIRRTDHPAAGLCIDIWHIERSGTSTADLAAVPVELIRAVELDDATAELVGDPYEDTVLRRRYLGEGEFRVGDFLTAIHGTGWRGPWGVEILSEVHRVRPLDESLTDVMRTTLDAFAQAGLTDA